MHLYAVEAAPEVFFTPRGGGGRNNSVERYSGSRAEGRGEANVSQQLPARTGSPDSTKASCLASGAPASSGHHMLLATTYRPYPPIKQVFSQEFIFEIWPIKEMFLPSGHSMLKSSVAFATVLCWKEGPKRNTVARDLDNINLPVAPCEAIDGLAYFWKQTLKPSKKKPKSLNLNK